jgi:hypothetical protein
MPYDSCPYTGCPNFGRYCRRLHASDEKEPPKEQKRYHIPKESATRKREKKVYKQAGKEMKATLGGECLIKSPECIGRPVYPHHIRGRAGKQYIDKKELMPACNPCNGWVERHPALAKKLGFKKSKHVPDYKREK